MQSSYLRIELERCSMQEYQARVITPSSRAQRPLLPNRNAIDDRRVTADLAHRVSAVRCYAVAESLTAVTDSDYALRVAVPSYVVDAAGYDVVFALGIDCLDGVPDTDLARHVTTGDVVAAG